MGFRERLPLFTIRIIHSPENIEKLRERGPGIIAAIVERMNLEMFKLQSEIVGGQIPAWFPNGAPKIAATVTAQPAELDGTVIRGGVTAGGPRTTKVTLKSGRVVDYAAVQHQGIDHSYPIEPFNKKALSFLTSGSEYGEVFEASNRVVVRRVIHPGLKPRPYMTSGLEAQREQIISGLQETFSEMMA